MKLRNLTTVLLVSLLCLVLPTAAVADGDSRAAMDAYWKIVGDTTGTNPLTRAMNDEYAALSVAEKAAALDELKAVTPQELLSFASANQLPVGMARHAWYAALADCLAASLERDTADGTEKTLILFLRMNTGDRTGNEERRSIRRSMTQTQLDAYAAGTGLPEGFLAWLLLDDEWHDNEWDDDDDWREGRSKWVVEDWVDAGSLREAYGREAVVDEDEVERVLRQHGFRFDD